MNLSFNSMQLDRLNNLILLAMQSGIYLLAIFLFTDKGESFRSIGLYLPPALLFIKSIFDKKIYFNIKNLFVFSLLMLCSSALISSLFSVTPMSSLYWFKRTYLKVFLIFIVISFAFIERRSLRNLFLLLSFMSLFFVCFTFYDYFTKALVNNHVVFDRLRPYGTSLPFLLPFVPYAIISSKSTSARFFWSLIIIAGSAAIMLTGFRGAWISGFLSITIWIIWFLVVKRRKTLPLKIIFGITITILIIINLLPTDYVKMRIHMGLSSNGRYEWRWKAYSQIYNNFSAFNKFFGKGLTKKEMYTEYNLWYKQKTGQDPPEHWPRNPHNNYLSLLFKQGITGVILYINLMITTLYMIFRKIKHSKNIEDKAMGVALVCPLISEYILRAMVEDMRFMPLGLLLGMAAAYINIFERK